VGFDVIWDATWPSPPTFGVLANDAPETSVMRGAALCLYSDDPKERLRRSPRDENGGNCG
jgi:hypothetical protein